MKVEIHTIQEHEIEYLWEIGFSKPKEWMKWNAPYFEEKNVYSLEAFKALTFYQSKQTFGVYADGILVGMVSYYWEDKKTKWLEIGGVIYNEHNWNKGIGQQAFQQLITYIFDQYTDLQHIGLTTFSGNKQMISCAKKLGMQQEACIRQVRFWQGVYYDSIKFGILRDEWKEQ